MYKPLLFLLTLLLLSGCAASLVYDRDRPRQDCRDDPQRRCLNGSVEPVRLDHVALLSNRSR